MRSRFGLAIFGLSVLVQRALSFKLRPRKSREWRGGQGVKRRYLAEIWSNPYFFSGLSWDFLYFSMRKTIQRAIGVSPLKETSMYVTGKLEDHGDVRHKDE